MKQVEIVTHCYAAQLPHYASALCYQLSSLVLHPPRDCGVVVTVCYCPDDGAAVKVIRWFTDHTSLKLFGIGLRPEELGRRCIGRNIAARMSKGDLVWFADCDMTFRDGCLDRLVRLTWLPTTSMVYPREIKIHCDHVTGDRVLNLTCGSPQLIDVDPNEFIDKTYNRAIGGVQIVQGDFARQHGYLDGQPRWQTPRTDGRPFGDFRDDLAYRGFCKQFGSIVPVTVPGVYRLRHTRTTYQ